MVSFNKAFTRKGLRNVSNPKALKHATLQRLKTKKKENKRENTCVSAHSLLIYVKNEENEGIFFQKDLEGIEYMRNFANVKQRVTPLKQKDRTS